MLILNFHTWQNRNALIIWNRDKHLGDAIWTLRRFISQFVFVFLNVYRLTIRNQSNLCITGHMLEIHYWSAAEPPQKTCNATVLACPTTIISRQISIRCAWISSDVLVRQEMRPTNEMWSTNEIAGILQMTFHNALPMLGGVKDTTQGVKV